jgi:hypothetical protein
MGHRQCTIYCFRNIGVAIYDNLRKDRVLVIDVVLMWSNLKLTGVAKTEIRISKDTEWIFAN